MNIIGLYGTIHNDEAISHDSGATLFVDGYHIRSINEERLSRIKEDGSFPHRSIDYVLGLSLIHI